LLTKEFVCARLQETEEAKEIFKLYTQLSEEMAEHETTVVNLWTTEIEATSEEKLKQSLIVRYDNPHPKHPATLLPYIRVNFDPMLLCLLREVKYFLQLEIQVPENALQVYSRGEAFRLQTGNLQLICYLYNDILATLLDVERPLVSNKLYTIDAALAKGLHSLNWNSHKIEDYISEVMAMLKELNQV
jgi:dynein heavy chain